MHLFQQHAVKDLAEAAAKIPVIDYGPYFAGEPDALARLAEQVRYACENIGFLYVLNHGVPQDVIDRGFAASRRFHALPLEEKLKLQLNQNNIGYMPMNASVQAASQVHKATKPNQNESFFISHDRAADHPDVLAGIPLRGRNQWPDDLPGPREDMMAYFRALGAMCDRMLPAFAVALDMPARLLRAVLRQRMPRQPALPALPAAAGHEREHLRHRPTHRQQLHDRAGAHRRSRPGDPPASGEWFPPPVIPGTFLVNLGNIMRRWSNDRFLSTPHGVINEFGTDRYSIAYFHSPNPTFGDRMPAKLHISHQPATLPKAVYRDLVLEFYRANYFHQQGHKSPAAALAAAE